MNQSPLFHRFILILVLLWVCPSFASSAKVERTVTCAEIGSSSQRNGSFSANKEVCELIATGVLENMRWPNFSDQRRAIQDFYKPVGYSLAWINQDKRPTEQALALIAALENADKLGLHPEDYDGPRWAERLEHLQSTSSPSADELARLDLGLTVSVMRYVSDQYRGRLNPAEFHFRWPRKECDTATILRNQLVKAKDVPAILDHLQPTYAGYQHTLKALNDYMAMAKEGNRDPLPMPAKPVWSGDIYPGVQQLAERLKRLGDMPQDINVPTGSELYEDNLKSAVRHFQQRHGLNPDGSLEPNTYKELTVPLERRIAQLQLALELWRWLPADLKEPWILINVPEFRLRAFSEDRPTLSMPIVVGEAPKHETPMFVDQMDYLIFRPDWRVPLKIQQNEIVPEIEKHPTYLAREHFQIFNSQGATANTTAINSEVLQKLRTGELELHQEPGAENELGLVKFIFPREDGVYMHGTVDHFLFSRFRRDLSHGCIRLKDPAALSAWALHGDSRWDAASIDKAMNGSLTMKVTLPTPVTVVTFYATAAVEDSGEVHFSEDIYGYDAALEKALARGRPYSETP